MWDKKLLEEITYCFDAYFDSVFFFIKMYVLCLLQGLNNEDFYCWLSRFFFALPTISLSYQSLFTPWDNKNKKVILTLYSTMGSQWAICTASVLQPMIIFR